MKRLHRDESGGTSTDVALALTFFLVPLLLILFQLAMVMGEQIDTARASGVVANMVRRGEASNPPLFNTDLVRRLCEARLAPGGADCRTATEVKTDAYANFRELADNKPSVTATLLTETAFAVPAPYVRLQFVTSSTWISSIWKNSYGFQNAFGRLVSWRNTHVVVVDP